MNKDDSRLKADKYNGKERIEQKKGIGNMES